MKVLVIGATKGIGKAVVAKALAEGHAVRAFARGAGSMDPQQGLDLCPGDALKPEDLGPALEGVDAVVMCLGIKESVAMLWQEVRLFSDATRALLPLMETHGPDRLIVVTGFGAGDSRAAFSTLERIGHDCVLGKPYQDKTRQEEMVRASSLRWTLVRPTILTNTRETGTYRVMTDPKDWRLGMISRADVAHYVVTALDDAEAVGAAPVLAR